MKQNKRNITHINVSHIAYLISSLISCVKRVKLPQNLRLFDLAWKTDHPLPKCSS